MAGPVYEFGGFRLDCGRFELSRDGRGIPLERKPMELLILLVERQGNSLPARKLPSAFGRAKSLSTPNTASTLRSAKPGPLMSLRWTWP